MQRIYEENPGKNPGRVLYKYWFNILVNAPSAGMRDGRRNSTTHFGDNGWRTLSFQTSGPADKPNISFGALFVLRHDGSFRVWSPRGGNQRRAIANHTFLNFGFYRGYNWLVDLHRETNWWGVGGFEDWAAPFQYVDEKTMAVQKSYGDKATWVKLVPSDTERSGWRMEFAEDNHDPTERSWRSGGPIDVPNPNIRTPADFEKFEALRLRRLRLAEVKNGRAVGTHDDKGRRIPTAEEIVERQQEPLLALIAAFDVHAPAKTKPLRREREEGLWALSGSQ